MNIALAQINYHIGNFSQNTTKVIDAIKNAKKQGADIVVFAEMAVSGYPPRDFLEFNDFIDRCDKAIHEIAVETEGIGVIIGAPTINPERTGKNLFNSAFLLTDGKVAEVRHKTLLPNYDIFDEYRYFEPNRNFQIIEYQEYKIALTICEDLWNISDDPLYAVNPMDELMKQTPDLMINIAASPFHYFQPDSRIEVLRKNVNKYKIPLIYVNHVGAQTEILFDGGSLVMNENAQVVLEMKYFDEDLKIVNLDRINKHVKENNSSSYSKNKIERIHDALIMGIRNYFEKLGFRKAILGLSGGIDSAVTLALAGRALGEKNINAILLPSQYSSSHSISDAKELIENLGCAYNIINIEDAHRSIDHTMEIFFKGLKSDITEENIQARLRSIILMALSNKFGYILLNTSNKSEAAVGYGTLYGDLSGGISVLGDVYKTDVFKLAEYINKDGIIIPENTIQKPPSAELRPDQKDSDSLPDYKILDKILYQYIELRKGPREIIELGYPEDVVRKILMLVNTSEYKRYQTSPTLRVSPKAFGMGRRMPIVAKYLS